MSKLDRDRLKRETFQSGRAIVLCDGQEWELPIPVVKGAAFYAAHDDDGSFTEFRSRKRLEDEFDELLEQLLFAETGAERLVACYQAAARLLQQNYDLSQHQTARLLQFLDDDEANAEMWDQLTDVLIGVNSPKPSPVGDAPA